MQAAPRQAAHLAREQWWSEQRRPTVGLEDDAMVSSTLLGRDASCAGIDCMVSRFSAGWGMNEVQRVGTKRKSVFHAPLNDFTPHAPAYTIGA